MKLNRISPDDFLGSCTDWFFRHTCQLLYKDLHGLISPEASGTLIHFEDLYILVTADHIFDNKRPDRFFIFPTSEDDIIQLSGRLFRSSIDGHYSKGVDFAYLILDKICYDSLIKYYSFITYPHLYLESPIPSNEIYFTTGVPYRKTSLEYRGDMRHIRATNQFIINNLAEDHAYKGVNSIKQNVIIKYGRKMYNPVSQNKELRGNIKGMSGGGLWYINDRTLLDHNNPPVSYIGILNVFDDRYIYSTKFSLVYSFIKNEMYYHRDLRLIMPEY